MLIIVKIGTSSLTDDAGHIRRDAIERLCAQVASARDDGHQVVVVSSGAIGAGLPAIGFAQGRPRDARTLQAASAVGQSRLIGIYDEYLAAHDLVAGQVLLTPFDFFERSQYLQARGTLERLLELGVVPIVNENDAIADDAIRFGDNDRIAALVAQLLAAERLILLTDMPGLYTADPRNNPEASLIAEVTSVLEDLPADVSGAGTQRGSGGMASKVAAAGMAAYSGITTVIAGADYPDVVRAALSERPNPGTIVRPHGRTLSAKKLWIGFALEALGTLTVDAGARRALENGGASLLAVGVFGVTGHFDAGEAVDIVDREGHRFARGISQLSSNALERISGVRSDQHPEGTPDEVVHRDELVVF